MALECSVDWLLAEAMKRLLDSVPAALPSKGPSDGPSADPSVKAERQEKLDLRPKPTARTALPAPRPPPRERPLAFVVEGARTVIDRDAFVIGRSGKEAQLVLRDPGVSRQHAIVERVGSSWVIVDMASTNGVLVNGTRVARALLRCGDVVEIGPFSIGVE